MEIATHPIVRASKVDRVNPIHFHHTRVCVSCVTNTGLPKSTHQRRGTAGKADSGHGWFLVWPGGEAVNHGPAPRSAGAVNCIGQAIEASSDQRNRVSPDQRRKSTYDVGAPPLEGGLGGRTRRVLKTCPRTFGGPALIPLSLRLFAQRFNDLF